MGEPIFEAKSVKRDELPINAWAIAGLVVLVIVGVLLVLGHHKPAVSTNRVAPLDSYAANLQVSQLAMSESTSLSGGKSTFIDGHIRNTGTSTVTAITAQVLFANEEQLPPQVETVPLFLIRSREPYIDTEPISANPLKPGDEQEFRLTFESLPSNWNTQIPEIHFVHVAIK
jgi:hypothetical protein